MPCRLAATHVVHVVFFGFIRHVSVSNPASVGFEVHDDGAPCAGGLDVLTDFLGSPPQFKPFAPRALLPLPPRTTPATIVAFFTVIQTTASIIVSVAAALLLVATCRRSPHRWRISSGTFFAIYAVLQAVAVGLVVATARKLEDGERSRD